jgi:hypothetical protein
MIAACIQLLHVFISESDLLLLTAGSEHLTFPSSILQLIFLLQAAENCMD